MATVTGLTAERMLEIEAACIVDGAIILDDLILTRQDGSTINAGVVKGDKGDKGDDGADAAPGSVLPVGDTTPIRTSNGRVKTATPSENDDSTPKLYVDGLVKGIELGASVDLNTVLTPGIYTQSQTAEATGGTNYPGSDRNTVVAGMLEVRSNDNVGGSNTMVWQTFSPYGQYGNVIYKRHFYTVTGWTSWVRYSSDDLLRHKAFNGGAATTNSTTTYIRIGTTGGGSFVAPPSGLVTVLLTMYLYSSSASVDANGGWEVRTGATVGSGTLTDSAYGLVRTRSTTWNRYGGASLCAGLTPGSTYNVQAVFASGTAGTVVNASSNDIVVIPSP